MTASPHDYPLSEERQTFQTGLRHFNDGDFFEAHDAWEEAWHRVADRRREKFYRGIIQAAVTLELLRRGRAVGVRQVFVSCLQQFEGLPEVFMGVRIPALIEKLRYAIGPALENLDSRHVPIDPARLFTIELEYDPFVESRNGEDCRSTP